jgi:hypothetical protein
MKKTFFYLVVLAVALMTYSCQQKESDGKCHIHGTVGQPALSEGKLIFLVPLKGPATAETVDSVVIKDGKFEFTPDSVQMYKILLDYHYRFGFQQLLIVGEPGDIMVSIDSISSAHGTPQNDSLQLWKEATERHNREYNRMLGRAEECKRQGNMALADSLKAEAKRYHLDYKNYSRRMSAGLKEGLLHDFLEGLFPLTYQRKMADGTMVTMDADTHEPIKE